MGKANLQTKLKCQPADTCNYSHHTGTSEIVQAIKSFEENIEECK